MKIEMTYPGPLELPLYWADDVSGTIPKAVHAYLDERAEIGPPATAEQLELVRAFFEYFIHAPCWMKNALEDDELKAELLGLRLRIKHAHTADEIGEWVHDCLKIGIDPL